MKHIITIIAALLVAFTVQAADKPKAATDTGKWIDSISAAPVGVIKMEHLDGPSEWGAGLMFGANVNPYVRIAVTVLSFEGADASSQIVKTKGGKTMRTTAEDPWGGLLVDQIYVQVDAKLSRFSNESFSLHLVSGGQYDWNDKDYGVNAGLRAELAFTKNLSLSAGYSVVTWFKHQTRVDGLASAQLTLTL